MPEETVDRAMEMETDLQGCGLDDGRTEVGESVPELEFFSFMDSQAPLKTCVTMLSRRRMHGMYQVRIQLETLAVELAAAQQMPDVRDCWDEIFHMEEAAARGCAMDFYQADLAFHRALWKTSQNKSLGSCLEDIVPKLTGFSMIRKVHPLPEELIKAAMLHRCLLEAIAAGNSEAAAKWMTASLHSDWQDDEQFHGIN